MAMQSVASTRGNRTKGGASEQDRGVGVNRSTICAPNEDYSCSKTGTVVLYTAPLSEMQKEDERDGTHKTLPPTCTASTL